MEIVLVKTFPDCVPPFALVTEQTGLLKLNVHPVAVFSVTEYDWKSEMFEKTIVVVADPSSIKLKLDMGEGEAVNPKEVVPLTFASLIMVIDPG